MLKKYTLTILMIFIPLVSAIAVERIDFETPSYLFRLYYDNSQLFADRDFEFKYDVIPETFVPEVFNTQFPYKGEVVNLKGEIAETFQFDPRRGDPKFVKGKISVKAPYVADGQKVNFYDGQGSQLLSIFVSESSFCNDDGACNADVGEDTATCPNDCKIATPVPTIVTEPSANGGIGGMLKFLIYPIIGIVMIGGWFGWKWWKRRQEPPPLVEFPLPPNPVVNFPDAQSAMPKAAEKSTTGQNTNVQ